MRVRELIRHIGQISKVIPLKPIVDMASSPPRIMHARCVDVFVEPENACKVAWTVHVSKIRVTGLATSRPSWNSVAGIDLKIT